VEPVTKNILTEDVNQLYRATACEQDYIIPTTDRMLNSRSIISFSSDSNTGLENWQQ
jgi:hypothetical protein